MYNTRIELFFKIKMLSTSQKKRQRQKRIKAEAEAAAATATTTTAEAVRPLGGAAVDQPPVPPDVPAVSREDLQQRVKQLRETARGKRTLSKRGIAEELESKKKEAARVGKGLMDQFRSGTLSARQLASLAELEKEFYEDCRGDAALFCASKGIDTRAVPAIEAAIGRVKAGETPENTLTDTVLALATALGT